MAKRPDWAMKSRTVLNINEFILFDMFGSPCWRVEILDKSTGSFNMVLTRTYVKHGHVASCLRNYGLSHAYVKHGQCRV